MHIFLPYDTKLGHSTNLPEESSQSKLWWDGPESRARPAPWVNMQVTHCLLLCTSACLAFSEAWSLSHLDHSHAGLSSPAKLFRTRTSDSRWAFHNQVFHKHLLVEGTNEWICAKTESLSFLSGTALGGVGSSVTSAAWDNKVNPVP